MNIEPEVFFLWIYLGLLAILAISAIVADLVNWPNWGAYLMTGILYGIYLFIFIKVKK